MTTRWTAFLIFALLPLFTAAQPRVAVLSVRLSDGVEASLGPLLRDMVQNQLAATGRLRTVDLTHGAAPDSVACVAWECLAESGRHTDLDFVVEGRVRPGQAGLVFQSRVRASADGRVLGIVAREAADAKSFTEADLTTLAVALADLAVPSDTLAAPLPDTIHPPVAELVDSPQGPVVAVRAPLRVIADTTLTGSALDSALADWFRQRNVAVPPVLEGTDTCHGQACLTELARMQGHSTLLVPVLARQDGEAVVQLEIFDLKGPVDSLLRRVHRSAPGLQPSQVLELALEEAWPWVGALAPVGSPGVPGAETLADPPLEEAYINISQPERASLMARAVTIATALAVAVLGVALQW